MTACCPARLSVANLLVSSPTAWSGAAAGCEHDGGMMTHIEDQLEEAPLVLRIPMRFEQHDAGKRIIASE